MGKAHVKLAPRVTYTLSVLFVDVAVVVVELSNVVVDVVDIAFVVGNAVVLFSPRGPVLPIPV